MQKICEYCGAQYEGRADSRFCSDKCRSAFNNRRRKLEMGNLDDSDEDEPINGYEEDEDEPLIGYEDDEDEPINGYDDEDTVDEEEEEEDADDEEDDADDDDPDYKKLEYELSNSRWLCDDLQKRNAKLVSELGEEKRKYVRLREELIRQTDRNSRLEQRINDLEAINRQRQHDKEFLNSIAPRPKQPKEPEQDREEIKDDFMSLFPEYYD